MRATAGMRHTESAMWTRAANESASLIEAPSLHLLRREPHWKLRWELESAREVQERLFPQAPIRVRGLDYAARCRPADSVGGDYYDYVAMRDGRLGLAVGDVSGKGIPAALLMASLQAAVRGLAMSPQRALSALMANLNRLMHSMTPANRYATLFFAAYESASKELSYVNCGHNAPMLFRGSKVLRLSDGGPAVGMFASAHYLQGRITLQAGDLL